MSVCGRLPALTSVRTAWEASAADVPRDTCSTTLDEPVLVSGGGGGGGVRVQRNSVLSGSDLEVPQMNGLSQLSHSPSVFLCVCVCPSVRLSECVRLYVRLSVCMSVYVRLSVRLSVCVCPSVCLRVSACLPVCVHQSVCACV